MASLDPRGPFDLDRRADEELRYWERRKALSLSRQSRVPFSPGRDQGGGIEVTTDDLPTDPPMLSTQGNFPVTRWIMMQYVNTAALTHTITSVDIANFAGLSTSGNTVNKYFCIEEIHAYVVAADAAQHLHFMASLELPADVDNGILGGRWQDAGRSTEWRRFKVRFPYEQMITGAGSQAAVVKIGGSANNYCIALFKVTAFM